jgi:hypothetical protein
VQIRLKTKYPASENIPHHDIYLQMFRSNGQKWLVMFKTKEQRWPTLYLP